ncbi:MAG: hypothetical protein ABSD29_16350 [Verrucomicrobiota bacterium]
MANAINIPKTHLVMGLSLPLAVLLGYFVAEPMELGSLAVVVFVLVALSIPLMLKWYYLLLVVSWKAAFAPAFLPGQPSLWAIMAFIGLLLAVLGRAVSANARFVVEPSVTKSLLALAGVVVGTGLMTGGFGVRTLGSGHYGGRNYFYFLAAVAGYFVFTSRRIPPHRAGLYVALFFLSGLTFAVGDLAALGGGKFDFLSLFFAPQTALPHEALEGPLRASERLVRISDLVPAAGAVYGYLLARFSLRGVLDLTRPWRLLLLLSALAAGLLSGFRGFVILAGMTFALMLYLEGLHRTRYAAALLGVALLGLAVVLPQAEKLPLTVQRALSFLPGKFNYVAVHDASSSLDWRLGMWKEVLPEVPKCLFRGKGWGIDQRDYFTGVEMGEAGNPFGGTIMVGNFHNGPLSILLPFGIYGAIAFVWFVVTGLRVLHRNWKFGNPALRSVNTLLLAVFAVEAVFFFCFFGSLSSDMAIFTGVLGLSVALNGADASLAQAEEPATGMELNTEYIKA